MIIFTECWRLMNDTCAISISDVGIYNNPERFVFVLCNDGSSSQSKGYEETRLTVPDL